MQLQRPPPMPASMTQAYLSPTNAYYGAPFLSGYDPRLYPAPGYPYLPPSTSPSAAAAAAAATSLGYLTGLYGTSYNHHHAGQPIPGFPALAGGVGIGMGAGSGGGSNIDFALLNGWAENQKSMERNALSTSSSSGTGTLLRDWRSHLGVAVEGERGRHQIEMEITGRRFRTRKRGWEGRRMRMIWRRCCSALLSMSGEKTNSDNTSPASSILIILKTKAQRSKALISPAL
ncbi:hypothetical protein BT69DRAFT_1029148 [Atractiella rhizophila]|nr:hypothetical protein BT69DRAFT_1029148 [Atractiella rhizophila]